VRKYECLSLAARCDSTSAPVAVADEDDDDDDDIGASAVGAMAA
jgi:hypothetical protein